MDKNVVPIILFIMVGIVICAHFYFNTRLEELKQRTLQKALDSGLPLTPVFLETVGQSFDAKLRDLRRGVILIALGLAVLIFGYAASELNPDVPVSAFSLFPLLVGFGYLLVWKLQDNN